MSEEYKAVEKAIKDLSQKLSAIHRPEPETHQTYRCTSEGCGYTTENIESYIDHKLNEAIVPNITKYIDETVQKIEIPTSEQLLTEILKKIEEKNNAQEKTEEHKLFGYKE